MAVKPTYDELLRKNIALERRYKKLKKLNDSTRNNQMEESIGQYEHFFR